jgi:RNA polymerase sigma-B factor
VDRLGYVRSLRERGPRAVLAVPLREQRLTFASPSDSLSLDAPRPGGEDSEDSGFGDVSGEEDVRFEPVELGATIAPALRALPERDRRILHLRFVEDMTQSQIATDIGVSQMHVSRLIRRSLARLTATSAGEAAPGVATAA